MNLEDALKLLPPVDAPLTLAVNDPARTRLAGQVVADGFRRLWAEHLVLLRAVAAMKQGQIPGSDYALVPKVHIDRADRLVQDLYQTVKR